MNQPTLGGFESLLDGNNIMVYLVVLLPGHLQTCLQVLLQVLHGFLHHVPKTLRDLAHGGQLVQCKLLVANLALVSRESTMKMISFQYTMYHIATTHTHARTHTLHTHTHTHTHTNKTYHFSIFPHLLSVSCLEKLQ